MAQLFLVRHAQAAFGTEDYDRLTPLGHQQARWLGSYFQERGIHFDRVLSGTLRRHRQTVESIGRSGVSLAELQADPRLNEYDPERLVAAHLAATSHARELPPGASAGIAADSKGTRKEHFRLLRAALTAWTLGDIDPGSHRSFKTFQEEAYQAFLLACQTDQEAVTRVLVVTSGGPISSILAYLLGMPASSFVALNLQVRNTGFCEMQFNSRGAQLVSFNNVPHLDTIDRRANISFS